MNSARPGDSPMARSFKRDKVPPPRDRRPFLAPRAPLFIEIGCGVGLHPIQYSKAHPEHYLVAIERTNEKYSKFEKRFKNHGEPQNLYPVFGDAIPWINSNIEKETVHGYFILYPNPYPKKKHQNRNFFNMPFFSFLKETLIIGGSIELATNSESYLEDSIRAINDHSDLLIVENKVLMATSKGRTHFEKKYLLRNENCFNVIIAKIDS